MKRTTFFSRIASAWALAGWLAGAGQAWPAHPGESPTPGSEFDNRDSANPALRGAGAGLSSSNLMDRGASSVGSESEAREELFKAALLYARELRLRKNYSQAHDQLTGIARNSRSLELKQTAMIELALLAQEQGQPGRAQQIYAQFVQRYPKHPDVPELLLRQGLLYRQMGAPSLALSKFYGVMNAALHIEEGDMERHRRLVLQAQTEIAETYYTQGDYTAASEFLARLLKLQEPSLNIPMVEFKLLRCLAALDRHQEVGTRGRAYLSKFPASSEAPEARFLVSVALQAQGRNEEALAHLSELLASQRQLAEKDPARWRYWQQRVGNQVANQFYQHGDYLHALELYQTLAGLDSAPEWQIPVWYQIALSYERLDQPAKAVETYQQIAARQAELKDELAPNLRSVVDMARWRADFLQWQIQATGRLKLPKPAVPVPQAIPHGDDRSPTSG